MTFEVTIRETPEQQQFLTEAGEAEVVKKLTNLWTMGENALRPARNRMKKIIRAYECEHEDAIKKLKRSKAYLPWTYTTIESAHSRLLNTIMPGDEDYFNLVGETADDQDGCDMMAEYIKAKHKESYFQDIFDQALKNVLLGEVVIKIYWKKETKNYTDREIVPVIGEDGQPVLNDLGKPISQLMPVVKEDILFNSVYYEVIPSDDFIIYPISGDISRTSMCHRVWRHYDELMAAQEAGVYVNVDRLKDSARNDKDFSEGVRRGQTHQQGLEVKEYWIHRITVEGKIYHDIIATIVDDKTLIRFEPNQYDYGLRPFIYCPLVRDFDKNTGHGIADRGYEIQKIANFVINQVLDQAKISLYGFYKYTEDGVFNPGNFISRPGGLVKVGDLNNLQPIQSAVSQLPFGLDSLQYLENQYETTVGVPKFLKGIEDHLPGKDTATAKRLAAEGADTRFRSWARRINENLLKPLIMMTYILIRQHAMTEIEVLEDIARVTQRNRFRQVNPETGEMEEIEMTPEELIQRLPAVPPLSKVDFKIVGFENVLDRADKASQFERFISGISQMVQFKPQLLDYIKEDQALNGYARYLNIEKEIMRDDIEMIQLQQQKMQIEQAANQIAEQKIIDAASRLGIDPRQLGGLMSAA